MPLNPLAGDEPLITVAMPIYNAGRYLRLAVLSIVQQTETNWELLIIDDGSTDNALESINDILDSRIRILKDGINKGLAVRLNEAIDLARGKYFARMDQDDVSYPQRFEQQIKILQADPAIDLVATRAILIDESNRIVGVFPGIAIHEGICARPWLGFYFPHPTWMGKVSWFRRFGYLVPGPYFCEDQELLLRSYLESRFHTVDAVLFGYRVRQTMNWKKLVRTRKAVLGIQFMHFLKRRNWGFLFMAIVAFMGRLVNDYVKLVAQMFFQRQAPRVSANLSSEWDDVLTVVSGSPVKNVKRTEQGAGNKAHF
jgi:glycosyltransferase involved in cell wall biosynthesis